MAELTIRGTYFTATDPNNVQAVKDALIMIDQDGAIQRILQPSDQEYAGQLQSARQAGRLLELGSDQYI